MVLSNIFLTCKIPFGNCSFTTLSTKSPWVIPKWINKPSNDSNTSEQSHSAYLLLSDMGHGLHDLFIFDSCNLTEFFDDLLPPKWFTTSSRRFTPALILNMFYIIFYITSELISKFENIKVQKIKVDMPKKSLNKK